MHGEKGERLLPISHHRNIMQNLKARRWRQQKELQFNGERNPRRAQQDLTLCLFTSYLQLDTHSHADIEGGAREKTGGNRVLYPSISIGPSVNNND
jgi:hypothetical protein